MTSDILAIAGAGTTALLGVAVVIVVYKLLDAVTGERAALAAELLAERAQAGAEAARDGALAAQKKAEAERDAAISQLQAVEKQRNQIAAKDATDEAAKVAAEPSAAAALDDVNRELGVPFVSGVSDGSAAGTEAAGGDHGQAGATAVQPAAAAPAGGARGRSAG